MLQSIINWLSQWGYPGIFISLVLGVVGLPIPDEPLLVLSGALAAQGKLHPLALYLVGYCGAITGITASYWLGRTAGVALVGRYGKYIHLTEERLNHTQAWFRRIGNWLLTVGYFVPGIRHLTALLAGTSCIPFRTFASYAYTGAVLWVSTFVTLGQILGKNWEPALRVIQRDTGWVILGLVLTTVLFFVIRRWVKSRYNLT